MLDYKLANTVQSYGIVAKPQIRTQIGASNQILDHYTTENSGGGKNKLVCIIFICSLIYRYSLRFCWPVQF